MGATAFKPKAYLKEGCPYSFKFMLFMAEADLLDRIDVVRCDPDHADFDAIKQKLASASRPTARPIRCRGKRRRIWAVA